MGKAPLRKENKKRKVLNLQRMSNGKKTGLFVDCPVITAVLTGAHC